MDVLLFVLVCRMSACLCHATSPCLSVVAGEPGGYDVLLITVAVKLHTYALQYLSSKDEGTFLTYSPIHAYTYAGK